MYRIKITTKYSNSFIDVSWFKGLTNFIELGKAEDAQIFSQRKDASKAVKTLKECMTMPSIRNIEIEKLTAAEEMAEKTKENPGI